MAADRFSMNKSWEQIQSKHVGTGHPDMTKHELLTNVHRDSLASAMYSTDLPIYFFKVVSYL